MYTSAIVTALVGALVCYFASKHIKGDISSLHSYHRKNVKDEDVPAFGKEVGLGTMIIGIAVIIMGAFNAVAVATTVELLTTIGMVIMLIGLVVGSFFTFRAMKKYNGGIF